MSYPDVEALWLARIRDSDDFDANNSSRGKWSILNSGKSRYYAILRMGNQDHLRSGMRGRREHVRQTVIELWRRPLEEGASAVGLQELADDLRQHLDQYKTLGDATGAVRDAMIVQTREMQERQRLKDGPFWPVVELVGECHEHETVTFS